MLPTLVILLLPESILVKCFIHWHTEFLPFTVSVVLMYIYHISFAININLTNCFLFSSKWQQKNNFKVPNSLYCHFVYMMQFFLLKLLLWYSIHVWSTYNSEQKYPLFCLHKASKLHSNHAWGSIIKDNKAIQSNRIALLPCIFYIFIYSWMYVCTTIKHDNRSILSEQLIKGCT